MKMKERPILFKGEMVRRILSGEKTQTRRVVKFPGSSTPVKLESVLRPDHVEWIGRICPEAITRWYVESQLRCPHGEPGDQLWVKETFARLPCQSEVPCLDCQNCRDGRVFRADGAEAVKWRSSIFMPRWASRITLEIVSVRVERLQDISDSDALAEGVKRRTEEDTPFRAYRDLWESIRGAGAWALNPWVWVLSFKTLSQA